MWKELLLAASNRMPIALALVNRTLSGPININCDHSDEWAQEILDGFRFMRKTIRKPMITLSAYQSPKVLESIYDHDLSDGFYHKSCG